MHTREVTEAVIARYDFWSRIPAEIHRDAAVVSIKGVDVVVGEQRRQLEAPSWLEARLVEVKHKDKCPQLWLPLHVFKKGSFHKLLRALHSQWRQHEHHLASRGDGQVVHVWDVWPNLYSADDGALQGKVRTVGSSSAASKASARETRSAASSAERRA